MKISTKGRYALRLMIDISMNDEGKPVRIRDIAERQQISDKYLEQIVAALNKAGLVKSIRGPQGGYHLTKNPSEYTVGSILCVIEGSLASVACLEDDVNQCPRSEMCPTVILWKKIYDAVTDVVESVTLADLVEWQKNIDKNFVI